MNSKLDNLTPDLSDDSSEELVETEKKLRQDMKELQDMLPPPNPLPPKTFRPSEPLFQSQKIPFETIPDFFSKETLEPFGSPVDSSSFPQKFNGNVTLKSLFPKEKLIYLRTPLLLKENFNNNYCNLKKLLLKRRQREKKNERNYFNPLLQEKLERYYEPGPEENTLVFESRFESGNLAMAVKVSESEYNLILQSDINSKGHTQWFFFSVEKTQANFQVKFNIHNFAKSDSLFNFGMKVLTYSEIKNNANDCGWERRSSDLMYYPNGIIKEGGSKSYYCLTFSYEFEFSDDRVFFAYSMPYTYSKLQKLLDDYELNPEKSQFFHRKTLCKSLGGNNCDYLTITNKGDASKIKKKRVVFISARVHPGETVGSWMMHGVMEFLTGNSEEAEALRDKYIFKLVPMLNPDGVINGNYRCSLVGADLNRRWKNPHPDLHPIIYSYKKLIKNTAGNYKIDLICDFHGHSRKNNIFMYGCNYQKSPESCKIFPFILSKISPSFSFSDSRFGVQKSKESTLRVSLFKELKIPNVFTLEASFCGSDFGEYQSLHYKNEMLEEMGRDVCRSLLILDQNSLLARNPLSVKSKKTEKPQETEEKHSEIEIIKEFSIQSIVQEILGKKEILRSGEGNISASGSESEPSEDNLDFEELKNFIPSTAPAKEEGCAKKFQRKSNSLNNRMVRLPIKKCEKCGEESNPKHICKVVESLKQIKRKVVGLRTYYNILGKKVHDQATQTLESFMDKSPKKRYLSSLDLPYPESPQIGIPTLEEPASASFSSIKHLPDVRIRRNSLIANSERFIEHAKKLQPLSAFRLNN